MSQHAITFGNIRNLCSRIDPISICQLENKNYENFRRITEVPHSYDPKYLYGFGMIESEFTIDGTRHLFPCIEFMLSERPKQQNTEDE